MQAHRRSLAWGEVFSFRFFQLPCPGVKMSHPTGDRGQVTTLGSEPYCDGQDGRHLLMGSANVAGQRVRNLTRLPRTATAGQRSKPRLRLRRGK